MLSAIGILGGLLAILGSVPYIFETTRRLTRPHRITWGLFVLVDIISIGNQLASGATSSVWLIVGFAISNLVIFLMSLKWGVGGTDKLDLTILAGAILGVVLWQVLNAPIASILANIVVTSLALMPTYKKAWLNPESETPVTFLCGAMGSLFAVISVGKLEFILLLLPIYLMVAQGGLYLVLVRHKQATTAIKKL